MSLQKDTGEKSFKCTFTGCNATFARSSSLRSHMCFHVNDRNFVCKHEGCEVTYKSRQALKEHTRIHRTTIYMW